MSNETMFIETKTMEFTSEPGQTVLINHNIRLNVREFRAKNGRFCLKLFIQLPKEMEVFQTKRSFEEMAQLPSKELSKNEVMRMLQKMMEASSPPFDKEEVCTVRVKKKRVQAASTEESREPRQGSD